MLMLKILIIDDQPTYVQSQIELAANMGIDLEHIDNWDEAQLRLEKEPSYFNALIIDGKGKLRKGGKEEDGNHLNTALKWIDSQIANGNQIVYAINTGFIEEIKQWFAQRPLYSKLGQETMMFEDLISKIKNLSIYNVEEKYADVLEAFNDKILPAKGLDSIRDLLLSFESKKAINKPFNTMRDILEMICKGANKTDTTLFPDALIDRSKNDKPNLKLAAIFFSGRKVDLTKIGGKGEIQQVKKIFNDEANWAFTYLVETCHILSHDGTSQKPHKYAFESALFGICELILCYKTYIQNNYK